MFWVWVPFERLHAQLGPNVSLLFDVWRLVFGVWALYLWVMICLWVYGLGLRVEGLEFGDWGSGFRG